MNGGRLSKQSEIWSRISAFSGLFPLDSDEEKLLKERRSELLMQEARTGLDVNLTSYISAVDLTPSGLLDFYSLNFSEQQLGNHELWSALDTYTLIEVDYRIRYCRSALVDQNFPSEDCTIWHTDENERFIYYLADAPAEYRENLRKESLLDAILGHGRFIHRRVWFAAKILSHFRRIQHLTDPKEEAALNTREVALMREWLLIGETWSAANAVVNSGKKALLGHKQKAVLDGHREIANSLRLETKRYRQEIIEKLLNKTALKGGALDNWLKEKLLREFDINVSKRTIRSDRKHISNN